MGLCISKASKDQPATVIQSFWRGYQARKQFGIKKLSEDNQSNTKTFLVGNDPKITGLDSHVSAPHETIALIGTSGLRSLSIICKIGNKETTPKLIIVDNSMLVVNFWRKFRALVDQNNFQCKQDFLTHFQQFLQQNPSLYHASPNGSDIILGFHGVIYENQNPILFLEQLIDDYGLPYLSRIIKSATILCHSWTDKTLFPSLKNILNVTGVDKTYLYPSNIAHCALPDEADALFENIQVISPKLSIITDRCSLHCMPERVALSTETNANRLKTLIFQSPQNRSANPINALEMQLIFAMMLGPNLMSPPSRSPF